MTRTVRFAADFRCDGTCHGFRTAAASWQARPDQPIRRRRRGSLSPTSQRARNQSQAYSDRHQISRATRRPSTPRATASDGACSPQARATQPGMRTPPGSWYLAKPDVGRRPDSGTADQGVDSRGECFHPCRHLPLARRISERKLHDGLHHDGREHNLTRRAGDRGRCTWERSSE